MVIPATNAVSECSASAVRRVKTYLKSTMSQLRFNNLLVYTSCPQGKDRSSSTHCLNLSLKVNIDSHCLVHFKRTEEEKD